MTPRNRRQNGAKFGETTEVEEIDVIWACVIEEAKKRGSCNEGVQKAGEAAGRIRCSIPGKGPQIFVIGRRLYDLGAGVRSVASGRWQLSRCRYLFTCTCTHVLAHSSLQLNERRQKFYLF